ncbi:golgi uridine diphosphate-N- acetylglucosamine transporter [Mucor velutinosus]|uniref:Golgi uridine diphosphate-N- acetylglucosamine transporter n=1 Tax=Mucor velutinosus TaxID=708070 RepID=A0AAN7DFL3_9FUNG|nr:golgi uridine diphosphate-N- acetylglucosamine transporter [Mucor velutinosus]
MSYNIIQHFHTSPSLYQDDEKKSILSHHYSSQRNYLPELPPTPSSSTLSFLVNDSGESIDNSTLESNTHSPRLPYATHPQYGSVFSSSSSDFNYMQTTSTTTPSTISPNDDDEGLYLLWTHQLLRERGYHPSSCRMEDGDQDDCGSMDSSITDLSTATYEQQQSQRQKSTNLPSWLLSWFPMC